MACRDNLGPPPERGTAVWRPAFSQGPTFTGTINPTSSKVSLGPTVIGNYPNVLLAEVKVEGLLTQFFGPDNNVWDTLAGRVVGPWDGAGIYIGSLNQCGGNAIAESTIMGFAGFCDCGNTQATRST